MDVALAILIGACSTTLGWLYTARRTRALARKQHTFSVLLQATFNKEHQSSLAELSTHLKARKCPQFNGDNEALRVSFRHVLNHYEFIAAALRNGDFDERLIRDTERATVVALFETCEDYIYALRDRRERQSVYEHLEWLYIRWKKKPPGALRSSLEWCRGRPMVGSKVKHTH